MNRFAFAAVTAVITAIITVAVLWVIIAFTGGSFVEALTQPGFWVVQGATIVLVSLAVLAPDEDARSKSTSGGQGRCSDGVDHRRSHHRGCAPGGGHADTRLRRPEQHGVPHPRRNRYPGGDPGSVAGRRQRLNQCDQRS